MPGAQAVAASPGRDGGHGLGDLGRHAVDGGGVLDPVAVETGGRTRSRSPVHAAGTVVARVRGRRPASRPESAGPTRPRTSGAGSATRGARPIPSSRRPANPRRKAARRCGPWAGSITGRRSRPSPDAIVYSATRVALPAIEISGADDPRVADYGRLKERWFNAEGGRFVAESERVVRRLIESGLGVHSVLLTAPRLATLADALGGAFPVYLAPQSCSIRSRVFTCTAAAWRWARGRRRARDSRRRAAAGGPRGSHRRRQPGGDRAARGGLRRRRPRAEPALRRSLLSQGDPRLAGRRLHAADRPPGPLAGRSAGLAHGRNRAGRRSARARRHSARPLRGRLPGQRCSSAPKAPACHRPPAPCAITG